MLTVLFLLWFLLSLCESGTIPTQFQVRSSVLALADEPEVFRHFFSVVPKPKGCTEF